MGMSERSHRVVVHWHRLIPKALVALLVGLATLSSISCAASRSYPEVTTWAPLTATDAVSGSVSPTLTDAMPESVSPTLTDLEPKTVSPIPKPVQSPDARETTQATEPVPTLTRRAMTGTVAVRATETISVYLTVVFNQSSPSDWTQLAGNPQRTGYVSKDVPTPWRVKWIWNGPVNGGDAGPAGDHLRLPKGVQPVVGGGLLYVGHEDGIVRAISESSGQQVWASSALDGSVVNTAAYDRDINSLYVGTTGGRFYRLNAATGQTIVSNRPGGQIRMAPLLVGNTVYIGSTNGQFYAMDKSSLSQTWSYPAGAALVGSPAYSARQGGLIILLVEDKTVRAIRASDGTEVWRRAVNADLDTRRDNTVFADTYAVVSDVNGVVIVRSYADWDKMWQPNGGAPSTVSEIRSWLSSNPSYQFFHVLNLSDGKPRFVAPVLPGAIGNGGDLESAPPQAVVKRLPDGTEVAYLLWRSRQACVKDYCDGREDTTIGEMDLTTGNIRFVQDYKGQGALRLPTDEQSPLAMAGDMLFHAHWQLLGAVRITDRSATYGGSYANPIRTVELMPVLNTLASGTCASRDSSMHYCPQNMLSPGESFGVDPGFYVYYYNQRVYDQYWTTPVRSVTVSNGTVYWKSIDGAITALRTNN